LLFGRVTSFSLAAISKVGGSHSFPFQKRVRRDKLRLLWDSAWAQELNQPLPAEFDVDFRSGKSMSQNLGELENFCSGKSWSKSFDLVVL